MLCIDTITALGLQYVFVRKAGCFIGELALVVITFRERNRLLSHGQLSWSFVDELGLELASRHPWLLTFLKSPKCVFSDGSKYNSWKAAAGINAAGCHELVTAPSDMSLTHISESADLISFDDELPVSTPRAEGVVSDVFVDDSPLNPSINDNLSDDRSFSRIEGLLCEMYQWTGRTGKATNELMKQKNVVTTAMNQVGALSDQFKQQGQKIDNLDQKFNRQEQKIDILDEKFNQQNQRINNLDQKFELKFDNFEQQLDIRFKEKFDNCEQKLDVRLREQLEQFESNFNDKLDTVISERTDANLSDRMQTEFDKFEGEMDLKFVKLRGEVMQVSEKFTDLRSAMTDELSDFRSTVIQEIDAKLDVRFNSVDEKFENLETNIINQVEVFEMSVNSRMDCIDEKVNSGDTLSS